MAENNNTSNGNASPGALTVGAKGQKMKDLLYSLKDEFRNALPKLIPPGKFIRTILTSFNRTPKLMECTPVSVVACLFQSAQLGLIPDGVTGEAYLIPFENKKKNVMECQFIPGYRGIVALAMRSGQVRRFQPRVVLDTDIFDFEYGLNEKLIHKPSGIGGKPTHFYCVLEFLNGGKMFDVMTVEEVNFVRDTSANYKASQKFHFPSTWDTHYEAMGMKTVVRRLGKLAPVSPDFQAAINLDEISDLGYSQKLDLQLLDKQSVSLELKEEVLRGMDEEQQADEQEKIDQALEVKTDKVNNTEASIFDKLNNGRKAGDK